MRKMLSKIPSAISILGAILALSVWGMVLTALPTGASPPSYMQFPSTSATITSTVDQEILGAPGANTVWKVTSLGWSINVDETSGTITIEDAAGTPLEVFTLSSNIDGSSGYIEFGEGFVCSVNSAVMVDFSGSTADACITIVAHRMRTK